MSDSYSLPDQDDVRKTLTSLLGKEVTVNAGGSALEPDCAQPLTVAVYQDAEENTVAVCVIDLPLSSSMGAALALIPPGVAEDCIRTSQIPENIFENVSEVLNVCVNLFHGPSRIRLSKVLSPGNPADERTVDFCDDSEVNDHFRVSVPGYSDGRISLYLK
ncbi:MAG: hypothetical protein RL885_01685 [Planctomycetota bacterium]